MNVIFWAVVLALIWVALTGDFSPGTLLFGVLVGGLVLWLTQRHRKEPRRRFRLLPLLLLLPYFLWQLILSNLRVAWYVFTPGLRMRPGIVAVPLDAATDVQIAWLANLITLTPGTISIDVSDDRRILYIHVIDIENAAQFRRSIKEGFERRVLEVWQ